MIDIVVQWLTHLVVLCKDVARVVLIRSKFNYIHSSEGEIGGWLVLSMSVASYDDLVMMMRFMTFMMYSVLFLLPSLLPFPSSPSPPPLPLPFHSPPPLPLPFPSPPPLPSPSLLLPSRPCRPCFFAPSLLPHRPPFPPFPCSSPSPSPPPPPPPPPPPSLRIYLWIWWEQLHWLDVTGQFSNSS